MRAFVTALFVLLFAVAVASDGTDYVATHVIKFQGMTAAAVEKIANSARNTVARATRVIVS